MNTLHVLDAERQSKYMKESGQGTPTDPFQPHVIAELGTNGQRDAFSGQLESGLKIGMSIAGVLDELWLCITPIATNANVYAEMTRIEQ